ncbi:glycosyltransferase family 9 protein [Salinisphaera sp. T31B1]|uniref:glycosyltransferase family 9 protein n=1 Tax=Salinisphaera sp. T31B1 TaxID=727963 RepID=UPI00333E26F8
MPDKHSTVNATGWAARIKRWRRNNRRRLNDLLTRLTGTPTPRRRPLATGTRRILVVRLNKRLGNILFLTPMLRTLAAGLPTARIDVLIQDARQAALLESLPGVGRIWVQQRGLWGLLGQLRTLRAQHYDLAIDPSGNSTSNRLAVALSGARQRMGFAGRSQWLRLTHAAPRPRSRHQAEQGVELLLDSVTGTDFQRLDTLAVFPDERAQAEASRHWRRALGDETTPVVGFFTAATGRKQMPADWWHRWQNALQTRLPGARLLQICPPGQTDSALPGAASVAIAELDVLAALLSRLQAFVAADSGPMHLAAAAGVPVVGLFRATQPARYAPLGHDCTSLTEPELDAERAAGAVVEAVVRPRRRGVA